jgi:PAS domain S-box-containing protein
MKTVVDLRRTEGFGTVASTDLGKQLMDQIRTVVRAIRAEERSLLDQRTKRALSMAKGIIGIIVSGGGLLLFVLLAGSHAIDRNIAERAKAEDALRTSEQRLSWALQGGSGGAWKLDLLNHEVWWSPEMYRLWGIEAGTRILPEDMLAVIHEQDREPLRKSVMEAIAEKTDLQCDFRMRHAAGGERWMAFTARLAFDKAGRAVSLGGITFDITDRKRAEEIVQERERTLRRFIEVAPVALAMFDREMRYLAVSGRYREDYNLGSQELVGRCYYDVFPEMTGRWREIHRRCLAGAVEQNAGEPFLRANGTEQWLRWEIQPWRDGDGVIGGVVLFSEDITRQKLAEQALQESEERFRALVTATSDIVYRMSPDWSEMRQLSGKGLVADTEAPSRAWLSEYIHPDDQPHVMTVIHEAIRTRTIFELEHKVLRADGALGWTFSRAIPLIDKKGEISEWFGTASDITQRKEAEDQIRQMNLQLENRVFERTAQLEAANKELEAFAYSVSHDLRAPLRAIDGWSLALFEDYADGLDDTARHYLQRVRSEAHRMGVLIDDLLRLSRVTRNEMRIEAVDLALLARAIAGRLQEANSGRQIEFTIAPGLTASGDRQLLEIMMTNLLGNAVKYTGPRAQAHIEFGKAQSNGDHAFFVRDDGVGFDMSFAATLFRAFQRLHKVSEFPGTGIGLATVHRIVLRHGGRIWAQAQPDRGATFYFTLGDHK